jgi:hypothetical protein
MDTNLRISLAYLALSGVRTHPLVFPLSPEGKRGNNFLLNIDIQLFIINILPLLCFSIEEGQSEEYL